MPSGRYGSGPLDADDPGADGMLSPTGWWLVTAPIDLRCGMDRLLVHVREILGRNPFDGAAYVFRNRASTRIKVLCCDAQGTWLAIRRWQTAR
jgi:transposase